MLNSCSTYRINRLKDKSYKEWKSHQWTAIKSSPENGLAEWTISSREVKGTNLLEYKIEGAIASSPTACVLAFRNILHDHADGHSSKKYPVYNILHESKDSLLTYVVHNEPFPFRDTEMKVQYVFINNENGNTAVQWNEAWNNSSGPTSKKLNRVETFRGSWSFVPTSGNSCQAANSVQFDPKGMPLWLIKPMVITFLKNGLEDIREVTSK
jgi:hypothetical protein